VKAVDFVCVPAGPLTATLAGPAVPAGTVMVSEVDPGVVTVAGFPPTVTLAVVRLVPVMTTELRPASGPLFGAIELTVSGPR
jgi:hypothetical protein